MIYLVKTQVRNGTYFKVGYTSNLLKRIVPYLTHNPAFELLETVDTYNKTKRQLETEIHTEIEKMGYQFKTTILNIKTEWFFVPMDKEVEFEQNGLKQFKACRNRKINKH